MRSILAAFIALGACTSAVGGSDDDLGDPAPAPAPDADVTPDPDPSSGWDAAPDADEECTVAMPEDIGVLGMVTATSKGTYAGKHSVYVRMKTDPYLDLLISAEAGKGAFSAGVTPGTYDIVDKDTDYELCGACVYMFAQQESGPARHVMASKGRLTVTSVVDGKMSGSLDDITLQAIEVVRDAESTTCETADQCENTACQQGKCGRQKEIPGCTMSLGSLSF